MDFENHIKLTKQEERTLIELGLYAMVELLKEKFEQKIFKQEQGIK